MTVNGRNFLVNFGTLVVVRFGDHISGLIAAPQTILNMDMPGPFTDDVEDQDPNFDPIDQEDAEWDDSVQPDEVQFTCPNIFDSYPSIYELGLSSEQISVNFINFHKEFLVDDFGPNGVPEVASQ